MKRWQALWGLVTVGSLGYICQVQCSEGENDQGIVVETLGAEHIPLPDTFKGEAEAIRLKNGMRVLLMTSEQIIGVKLSVSFLGGAMLDPKEQPALGHLTEHMLCGARGAKGQTFWARTQELGLEGNAFTDISAFRMTMMGPESAIEGAVDVVLECLTESPNYEDLEAEVDRVQFELKQLRQLNEVHLYGIFRELSNPVHPMSWWRPGFDDDFDVSDPKTRQKFVERISKQIANFVDPRHGTVAIAANVKMEDLRRLALKFNTVQVNEKIRSAYPATGFEPLFDFKRPQMCVYSSFPVRNEEIMMLTFISDIKPSELELVATFWDAHATNDSAGSLYTILSEAQIASSVVVMGVAFPGDHAILLTRIGLRPGKDSDDNVAKALHHAAMHLAAVTKLEPEQELVKQIFRKIDWDFRNTEVTGDFCLLATFAAVEGSLSDFLDNLDPRKPGEATLRKSLTKVDVSTSHVVLMSHERAALATETLFDSAHKIKMEPMAEEWKLKFETAQKMNRKTATDYRSSVKYQGPLMSLLASASDEIVHDDKLDLAEPQLLSLDSEKLPHDDVRVYYKFLSRYNTATVSVMLVADAGYAPIQVALEELMYVLCVKANLFKILGPACTYLGFITFRHHHPTVELELELPSTSMKRVPELFHLAEAPKNDWATEFENIKNFSLAELARDIEGTRPPAITTSAARAIRRDYFSPQQAYDIISKMTLDQVLQTRLGRFKKSHIYGVIIGNILPPEAAAVVKDFTQMLFIQETSATAYDSVFTTRALNSVISSTLRGNGRRVIFRIHRNLTASAPTQSVTALDHLYPEDLDVEQSASLLLWERLVTVDSLAYVSWVLNLGYHFGLMVESISGQTNAKFWYLGESSRKKREQLLLRVSALYTTKALLKPIFESFYEKNRVALHEMYKQWLIPQSFDKHLITMAMEHSRRNVDPSHRHRVSACLGKLTYDRFLTVIDNIFKETTMLLTVYEKPASVENTPTNALSNLDSEPESPTPLAENAEEVEGETGSDISLEMLDASTPEMPNKAPSLKSVPPGIIAAFRAERYPKLAQQDLAVSRLYHDNALWRDTTHEDLAKDRATYYARDKHSHRTVQVPPENMAQ